MYFMCSQNLIGIHGISRFQASFATYFQFPQSLKMQNLCKSVLQLALGHHQKHDQDVPYTIKVLTNKSKDESNTFLLLS